MKNQQISALNLSGGLDYFSEGFRLIKQPGLRLFVIAPLIINILVFYYMVTASYSLFGGWMTSLMEWLPSWLSFLEWLFWPLYAIAIIMVLAYCFVAVANLIGSPFYGLLSEKVEQQLTGEVVENSDDWKALIAIIPRSIARELHKLMYYLPRALLLLVLIPMQNMPNDVVAQDKPRISVITILKRSNFWPFLMITALLQGAHAAYYGFGAVYWQDIGISETYIGYFWSVGVIGEIFFLAFGKRFFGNSSIAMMFCIAALGSIVRWLTLAYAVDVWTIMLSQLLHGVTFGVSHLAAMRYMSERVSDDEAVATQSIYAAIPFSLGISALTFACGMLYPSYQEGIFVLMAVAILPVFGLIMSSHIRDKQQA